MSTDRTALVEFRTGICVGLQVITCFDNPVAWAELVRTAGIEEMLNHAAHVEPDEWELAGFAKYARVELGRNKPRKAREQCADGGVIEGANRTTSGAIGQP